MSRAPLVIIERETTIVVRGNALTVLRDGGFRGMYVGTVRGWILDRGRLADLCAYLSSRHVGYTVTASATASTAATVAPAPDVCPQLDDLAVDRDLFGEVVA